MGLLYLGLWAVAGAVGIALASPTLLALFALTGAVGYGLALKGGRPFTDGPLYIASRWSGRNLLFPTQVAIAGGRVTRYRARVIGHDEESIPIAQIASVKIRTSLLWSDVIIESTGGQNQIVCHGHLNRDAVAIKTTIEAYQQRQYAPEGAPGPALLFALYPAAPPGIEPLHRWPTPLKQVPVSGHLTADETLALLLGLLDEGGPGSAVHVTLLSPEATIAHPRRSTER
jgi:hypothetical protein